MSSDGYRFTVDWFSGHIPLFNVLLDQIKPSRILEIGSFEGRSSCYFVEKLAPVTGGELHCVDTWQGGIEHQIGSPAAADMESVESRFDHNISYQKAQHHAVSVHKHKMRSVEALAGLLASKGGSYFDVVYIDGSHQAPDVLTDAVLAYYLVRKGGLLAFDDYLWGLHPQHDYFHVPKGGIDAFTNVFQRKVVPLSANLYQLYLQKIED